MNVNETQGIIESILFASGEPIQTSKIADAMDVEEETVHKLLKTMQDKYESEDRGLVLVEMSGSYQLTTKIENAEYVKKALTLKKNNPLSNAAMEVLALVAYNQPVTRGFIEQVRGVESSQIVSNLVEKGLLEEAGRLDMPGRPIAYKTTLNFLRCFSLNSIENLPPLPDDDGQIKLDDIIEESDKD